MDGQTVVITGAASGLGRAFAQGFAAEGATVVGCDIDEDGLAAIESDQIITTRCDVSVDEQVRAVVDLAVERTGRVDVLFNNAGYGNRTRVEDLAEGEFEKLIAVHLYGCIYGMRAAIPIMRRQNYGRIVNIVSRGAESDGPGSAAYGAAKAGMWVATRNAATETSDADILVNAQFPGMTNTAIWGRDMPGMQPPEAAFSTALMLATLPAGGPSGKTFYREQEYAMFDPGNDALLQQDLAEMRARAEASRAER